MNSWRDPAVSPDLRAKNLLSQMTLEEKVAQLRAVWASALLEGGKFSLGKAEAFLAQGIGAVSRPAGSTSLSPEGAAEFVNAVQKYLLENTRLGIPALVHEECLAGVLSPEALLFPQPLALASTWEPKLVEEMANFIRDQLLALGVRHGLAPVLDVVRDPRWGRVEETFGEDAHLGATMGTAYVRGLQGQNIKNGVMATLKHFAGHGASEAGKNCAPSHIPERELREVFLFPFECAACAGGALAVMPAYNEIDGVPCTGSTFLLSEILRDSWKFSGIVVSDYFAVEMLWSLHRVARNREHAAQLALAAGVDLELPHVQCFGESLERVVKEGSVPVDLIDHAVFRVLRIKFLLGLFENPFVEPEVTKKVFSPRKYEEGQKLAREIVRKSIILLKNDGILPLSPTIRKIAVIGPSADDPRNYLGDYHFPAHAERFDAPALFRVSTVLRSFEKRLGPNVEIIYAKGCDVADQRMASFTEAVAAARASEVAIVVVGDRSGLSPLCTVGESRDAANLRLPGAQEKLVQAIAETGTPVILVLLIGRPYVLTSIIPQVRAALVVWLPGEMGGEAIVDVILGDHNPGGKLPVTFPRSPGQIPIYYRHKPSGSRSHPHGDYVDEKSSPLFPFGYGLSYTEFQYSDLRIEPKEVPAEGEIRVSFILKNVGERAGEEVVQLYIGQEGRSVTRPIKELKGFARVALKPGEAKLISFIIPMDILAFYDQKMNLVIEPGAITIMIGSSSEDIRLTGTVVVRGSRRIKPGERKYFGEVIVGADQKG
ncbi:MAG: glycoside hydrolase family 3 C-terminal domain-containing protein [Candidatus Bipolaricaulota bacterium]|nr:glycoside hydrolase family 3 C-terminal domain-containing protein [Candidatus Bipolaricaulota bacterium]MDW8126162.1 glycoside hydrolase family 3 N-terminal domain-containing protein [Candidatus Bipolaricaulota bacterium]